MKIRSKLLIGCETPKEKAERKKLILENKYLFDTLKEVIESDLKALEISQVSTKRYDSGTWAYRQADYNGSKRTLNDILTLLTIEV